MIKHPNKWLISSFITIIVSAVVIASLGLNFGIDFIGGSLLELEASSSSIDPMGALLQEQFNLASNIQTTQDGSLLIRTTVIDEATHQKILSAFSEAELFSGQERRFESIGPTIGQELRQKSLLAIALVVVVMIAYLAYTFRNVRGLVAPWKFGVAAVYALLHDLILVTALFAIFGKLWDAPIDTLFVTAQLAILGYSVNDTIVLFDRMRTEHSGGALLNTINSAMKVTLGRSLNTSFTTLLVLVALLVFGGSTIRWFVVALALGTITGTYSSLFVAPPLLHYLARPRK